MKFNQRDKRVLGGRSGRLGTKRRRKKRRAAARARARTARSLSPLSSARGPGVEQRRFSPRLKGTPLRVINIRASGVWNNFHHRCRLAADSPPEERNERRGDRDDRTVPNWNGNRWPSINRIRPSSARDHQYSCIRPDIPTC